MKRWPLLYIFIFSLMTYYIFLHANILDGDYSIFYQATHLFQHRFNPYSLIGQPNNPVYGFTYLPTAFIIMFIPTLIPFGFSLLFWTFCCYLMLAGTAYMWFELTTGESPNFEEFVWSFILASIAPTMWSFWLHQLTMPVIFFSTCAIWLMVRRQKDFLSGLMSGLLLIKPHLALPLLAWLALRAQKRWVSFVSGFALMALISFSPFFLGYRPATDLRDLKNALTRHATTLYSRDEQGIEAIIYKSLFFTENDRAFIKKVNVQNKANLMLNLPRVRNENRFKKMTFLILWSAWVGYLILKRNDLNIFQAALACALGVLISPYSHLYDGVMLIPLLFIATVRAAFNYGFAEVACVMFFVDFALTLMLPFNLTIDTAIFWDRISYASFIYLGLSTLIYFSKEIEEWVSHTYVNIYSRERSHT